MSKLKAFTTVNVLPDESVIYNITLNNPKSNELLQARNTEVRTQPLLMKQDDYKFALLRANIPTTTIPIFFQEPDKFKVTLEHLSDALIPVPTYSDAIELPYTVVTPYPLPGQPVWTAIQFINSINEALSLAFDSLIFNYEFINGVGSWTGDANKPQHAPFVAFTNNLITFFWDIRSNKGNGNDEQCNMYWSYKLGYKLQNANLLSYNSPNSRDWKFSIPNYGVNILDVDNGIVPSYKAVYRIQESATVYLWYEIFKIVITSSSLAVRKEYVSVSGGADDVNSQGRNIVIPVLEDFIIELGDDLNHLSKIIFYPAGETRRIDMLSDQPLNKIDFQLFYQDESLNLRPIFLQPGETIDLKFSFTKKY